MNDLTLLGIESDLHDLFTLWQEADTPEAVAAAESAIQACAEAQVRKVDGVRSYLKFCEGMAKLAAEEAKMQSARSQAWKSRGDRLKAVVFDVMERFKLKKLDGQHGSLILKGNGGKQAVVISDECLVPDEFATVTVKLPAMIWKEIIDADFGDDATNLVIRTTPAQRVPSALVIGAELERGEGVPGCSLAERGRHVEIK